MDLRRLALPLLLVASGLAAVLGDGAVRDAGVLGVATWLVVDLEIERRRDGWRSALAYKGVTLGLVGCLVATLSGVPWLQVAGWAGFFVAAWAGAGAARRRASAA